MGVDPMFGLNSFNKPNVLSEIDTEVHNILALLFGKPGFYPSIPKLGMNIEQYLYKFEDEIDPQMILAELASQCRDFLPEIQSGDIDVRWVTSNGNRYLLFILPVILSERSTTITLGITKDDNTGEIRFNFIESNNTTSYSRLGGK